MEEIKTALTAQNEIFNVLIAAGVIDTSGLTGCIYELSRPDDSQLEDIVVGTLSMGAEQVQEGVFNVNIHVPNLKLTSGSTQPDKIRLKEISDVVTPVLSNYYGYDFNFDIKSPGIPYRDGLGWFVNIQVSYISKRKHN